MKKNPKLGNLSSPPSLPYEFVAKLLSEFIYKEITRTGYQRGVIGLSGGLDSSVVAALMVNALGPQNCLGLILPYRTSSAQSEADAMQVAQQLQLPTRKIDITPIADAYDIETHSKLRKGNFCARIRMALLFDIAMETHALVVGTSNKTEILLGYSTWFGDSAWSLAPIGDLYKKQVIELAQYLNLPPFVWEKPPTADLWEGQTDEGELGFLYEEADTYLYHRVDLRKSIHEIVSNGFSEELANRIELKIHRNHYKRVFPPIAKIQARTVGIDYLYARDFRT
ncbi:MAG: NAD+ synthase [bacterium]|nr:NAD+ synthase [bacterium]